MIKHLWTASIFLTVFLPLQSTNFTWTGLTQDNNFQTQFNWNPFGVPGAADTAIFNATPLMPVQIFDMPVVISTLDVVNSAHLTLFNEGTFTVFNTLLNSSSSLTFTFDSGLLVFNGSVRSTDTTSCPVRLELSNSANLISSAVELNGAIVSVDFGSSNATANFSGCTISDIQSSSTNTAATLTLSGAMTLENLSENNSFFAGKVTGTSGFILGTINGSGSLTLTNPTNSFSGGVTINSANTLITTSTGSLGTGTLTFAGGTCSPSGILTISNHLNITENSFISALAGMPTFTGSWAGSPGTILTVSGPFTFAGSSSGSFTTLVNSGTSYINGQLPTVEVASGAVVKGNGPIQSLILDAGATVSPGNSIGTLTVGSVNFNSSSLFQVELDPIQASAIDCTGAATLGGASVTLSLDFGDYPKSNVYPIFQAASITGSFNPSVLNVPAGFNFSLSQVGNNYYLSYTLSPTSTLSLSGNQLQIANYLNENGTSSSLLFFNTLSDGALKKALNVVSPARNAYANFVLGQTAFSLSQLLSTHLDNWRVGEERVVNCCSSPFSIWLSGFEQFAHFSSSQQNPPFNWNGGAATLGFDYLFKNKGVLGAAVGYAHTHYWEKWNGGYGKTDSTFLSLYGNVFIDRFYISPALWGISSQVHNKRKMAFSSQTASADIRNWQVVPHLEVGSLFSYDCLDIVPFTAADWAVSWQNSYTEQGAVPFNMHQRALRSSMVRSETGIKLCEKWRSDWGIFLLKEKLSYVFEKPFDTGHVKGAFAGIPGNFTVTAVDQILNLGNVGLDFLFLLGENQSISLDLDYEGEFGSRYWSNQFTLTLGKEF